MLKIIIPTIILIPLTWISKPNIIWINTTTYGLLISLISLFYLNQPNDNTLNSSLIFFSDSLSAPLLALTTWLLPLILIASQHHLSKEPLTRKKTIYFNTNSSPIVPNYNFHCLWAHLLLHPIWSNTDSDPDHYYPMRKSNWTTKRRTLLLILYFNRIPPTPSSSPLYPQFHGLPKFSHNSILNPASAKLLIQYFPMTGMHNSIHSKDTSIRPPLVTTKSTRRGPYCRLHSTCRCTPKTRRLWHDTNYNPTKSPDQFHSIPLHNIISMRHNHNKLYLSPSNRSKIPNCILLS